MMSPTHASPPLATRISHFFQLRTERGRQPFGHLATSGVSRTRRLALGEL